MKAVGNVLAATRIADGQHIVLHMRRLADLYGRDARHEGWIVHADKRQVGVVVEKLNRTVVEHVLVVLADADVARVRDAMRACEDAPLANDDAGPRRAVRAIDPWAADVRLGCCYFQFHDGVERVVPRKHARRLFLRNRHPGNEYRKHHAQDLHLFHPCFSFCSVLATRHGILHNYTIPSVKSDTPRLNCAHSDRFCKSLLPHS